MRACHRLSLLGDSGLRNSYYWPLATVCPPTMMPVGCEESECHGRDVQGAEVLTSWWPVSRDSHRKRLETRFIFPGHVTYLFNKVLSAPHNDVNQLRPHRETKSPGQAATKNPDSFPELQISAPLHGHPNTQLTPWWEVPCQSQTMTECQGANSVAADVSASVDRVSSGLGSEGACSKQAACCEGV